MINSVRLINFRGIADLTVPLTRATMLTGLNGVGKTSVLEGLYCLFSETMLDVSPLTRYMKSVEFNVTQGVNNSFNVNKTQGYNYKAFWDECPAYGNNECRVEAKQITNQYENRYIVWHWSYKKARLSDLSNDMIKNNLNALDSSTEFALWDWYRKHMTDRRRTKIEKAPLYDCFSRAQVLTPDGKLYLSPSENQAGGICQYLDLATIRVRPNKLPFSTAQKLTEALQIIDPRITDVRFQDADSDLSVVLNNKEEFSLGTLGNGAVTWVSTLINIFEVADIVKQRHTDLPAFILMDEIGTGIHYSIMLDAWKFLAQFVKQNPLIQFVFTTHNDDCVRAFCEVFKNTDHASIIQMYRNIRKNEEKIAMSEFDKKYFQGIIDGDWEVRG